MQTATQGTPPQDYVPKPVTARTVELRSGRSDGLAAPNGAGHRTFEQAAPPAVEGFAPKGSYLGSGLRPMLSHRQKAAVIVRLLASEGLELPLSGLTDEMQTVLTGQLAQMRAIDRATLAEVIEEFCDALEGVGLTFPQGLDDALSLLDGQLSASAAGRLRRMIQHSGRADPWARIAALPAEALLPILLDESAEIGAVVLSKLSVAAAADLLGKLPGDRARRLAYAVSLTGNVAPETVQRIGSVLIQQLDAHPSRAFDHGPVERMGAILNHSAAGVRDAVLNGLADEDEDFAYQVRKAIFTFPLIPERISATDIPKVLRNIDLGTLTIALSAAQGSQSAEFILTNMSQRLATSLREEIAQLGPVKPKDAEAAQAAIVAAIREKEAKGEIAFLSEDQDP